MDKKAAEHAAEILKAMAHPVRLQIVELLQAKEMCVNDIVEALASKQAITSQQLNMMKDKSILNSRRDGTRVYYHIENKNVIKLTAFGGTILTTLPIFAIITNSYTIKLLHCIYGHCKGKTNESCGNRTRRLSFFDNSCEAGMMCGITENRIPEWRATLAVCQNNRKK